MAASPVFECTTFSANSTYQGAKSALLACTGGDTITFTATIKWLGGSVPGSLLGSGRPGSGSAFAGRPPINNLSRFGVRPMIGVWFWDSTETVSYGAIQIAPPNTDNGWHIGTYTVIVPQGAALMYVGTWCELLGNLTENSYFVGYVSSDG
jgi:hypothetical protein